MTKLKSNTSEADKFYSACNKAFPTVIEIADKYVNNPELEAETLQELKDHLRKYDNIQMRLKVLEAEFDTLESMMLHIAVLLSYYSVKSKISCFIPFADRVIESLSMKYNLDCEMLSNKVIELVKCQLNTNERITK